MTITQECRNRLYREAFQRIRHRETAENIVQDTLLEAIVAKQENPHRDTTERWLFGILKNHCVDHLTQSPGGKGPKEYRQEQLDSHAMPDGERRTANEWRIADRICDDLGHVGGSSILDDSGEYVGWRSGGRDTGDQHT